MNINQIIMLVMAVFFILGAFDRLFGNRLGMGAEFERAFGLCGTTSLAVLGLMCMAPVVASALQTVLVPLFSLIGAESSVFPGIILSCEIAYPLSAEMGGDPQVAKFGGMIVGSVMGYIISFAIPVACGLIRKCDYRAFSIGILAAYIFDPLACFIGGLAMGIPAITVLINLIPVLVVAVIIVLGLIFIPEITITVFRWFARLLLAVITVGLCAAAFEAMTGIVIIPGMNPIGDGFRTIGIIVLSLAGSLPLLYVLRRLLQKPLEKLGARLGINDITMLSMIIAITSLVPGYSSYTEMNLRGRVLFAAFSASAGCMLGCHLGYTSAADQQVVGPMLFAKCCAGVFALLAAVFFSKRLFPKAELDEV